jgi:thiol-disulfide isomerase/thioredoxin
MVFCGCWADEAKRADLRIELPAAPDFILPRLEGGDVVSLDSLAGKIVILDLWATWCPPCGLQVPVLNAFYEAHRDDGDVVLYGVSVDQTGVDDIREWVTEHAVLYPNLVGGDPLSRELGAVGFPALFVIGPDGLLVERHEGVIERETLEGFLAGLRTANAAG